MRCFIALDLPPTLRLPLVRFIREHAPRDRGLKWSSESQLHVTLKFLGDVDPAPLAAVHTALQRVAADVPPPTIQLTALGCFPSPHDPRVLWCGMKDGARRCTTLAERIEAALEPLGFELERRPFTPHVTLARVKNPDGARAVRRILESAPLAVGASANIAELTLFESRLSPRGAEYRVVATFALSGGSA